MSERKSRNRVQGTWGSEGQSQTSTTSQQSPGQGAGATFVPKGQRKGNKSKKARGKNDAAPPKNAGNSKKKNMFPGRSGPLPLPRFPNVCGELAGPPVLLSDEQVQRFIVQGYLVVESGLPNEFHKAMYDALNMVLEHEENPGNNILPRLPHLRHVYNEPHVRGALQSLLGEGYIMQPHRFCHHSPPGKQAQLWHKDSYWGYRGRIRHHRPRSVMAMYYPQDVTYDMGPTAVRPGSQYYTHHDNRDRVKELPDEWSVEDLPLVCSAGTVVIIHYDIFHRATFNRTDINRYMMKFQFTRMVEPTSPSWASDSEDWLLPQEDFAQPHVWRDVWTWLRGGVPATSPESTTSTMLGSSSEPTRVSDCYDAGRNGGDYGVECLMSALSQTSDPDACEAHGLVAAGTRAIVPCLQMAKSAPARASHLRRHLCFVLGEVGRPMANDVVMYLAGAMQNKDAGVRRHAAESLGSLLRDASEEARGAALASLGDRMACDSDEQVRFNAALAIGQAEQVSSADIARLCEAIDTDTCRYVQGYARLALESLSATSLEARSALHDILLASSWCAVTTTSSPF